MHNMHIKLIAHSPVKMRDPTPECQNQIYPHVEAFHGFFTDCSRPFHEFFTVFSHVWLLRCSCIFFYDFCGNCEDINFIANKYRKGTLTAAILQTGGTPTSSRQRFSLLGPHQTWCSRGSTWESLHFILLHNHDVDGKSWPWLF
jgi:hypothetical protein